jgi:Holliday junction resolvase RusA-like endonuclease
MSNISQPELLPTESSPSSLIDVGTPGAVVMFVVEGEPKPQPRARAFAMKGRGVRMYDPGTAEGWKAQIAAGVKDKVPFPPWSGPVEMTVVFRISRPKGHYGTGRNSRVLKKSAPKYPTGKPDLDNYLKAVMDALSMLSFWTDDSIVVQTRCSKVYTNNYKPGALIVLKHL